jgi:thiamine-monophosphate kinase
VTCCIDVSDGLFADAGHVAAASGVALHIWLEEVRGFSSLLTEMDEQEAVRLALSGGEDYSLLFTADVEQRESLQTFAHRIGECRKGSGVHITLNGRNINVVSKGYNHFS